MAHRIDVMVSSTFKDFETHRQQVIDAIMRLGMHPIVMEYMNASDADALTESLRVVEEAEVYVGIFGFRYGYVPDDPRNPDRLSITELEYRRAGARGIPRYCFFMADDHPITIADTQEDTTDEDEIARRKGLLAALKQAIGLDRVILTFKSPDELRGHVALSLAAHRDTSPAAAASALTRDFDIPSAPEVFIAHPYTLLAASDLVGRREELNLLTAWGRGQGDLASVRLLHIVAIGGMGKSALTWKWFSEIAPQEMPDLAGRMWWSFYESGASFENFVIDALAYTTGQTREAVKKLTQDARERALLHALNARPFLIVLDGLERILTAYARLDAARLADDNLDRLTANTVRDAVGLPAGAETSFTGEHRLRRSADPRADAFLRRLTTVNASRVLISTRLYPAALQEVNYAPLRGCYAIFLKGLGDDDAVALARGNGLIGTADLMLRLFKRFDNYPLLVRALAREVAGFRRAPGDLARWLAANPDFERVLAGLKHDEAKSHVLAYALRGLTEGENKLLALIAAFRMPASYDSLHDVTLANRTFANEAALDAALEALEDRGLIGWDRAANRYDLHPIVRGVAWGGVNAADRAGTYEALRGHFAAMPTIEFDAVESLDDLAPAIELYTTLIGLERYDDACDLFYERLQRGMHFRLSAARQRVELLAALFPDGLAAPPRLRKRSDQSFTLNALAQGYQASGGPGRAADLFARGNAIDEADGDTGNLVVGLCNLSDATRLAGGMRASEAAARRALTISREASDAFGEAVSLYLLGLAVAMRGTFAEGLAALERSRALFVEQSHQQFEGVVSAYLAQAALWAGDLAAAEADADRAWQLAGVHRLPADFIRAAHVQGAAALALGDLDTADAKLHDALTRARAVNFIEEELPALTALAELARRRNDPDAARDHLDGVWDLAERGPYPLFHADALNVLAQIERDAGNRDAAIAAATRAYTLAWCDGISADGTVCYAYAYGLRNARAHLEALGAPIPQLPPFDESAHPPMVEVAIDP